MKRKISLLLIVTVLMTMAIPSVSLAETLGTSTVVDNEYYYESFEGYAGASGWFDTSSTNGYYSNAGDIFSTFNTTKCPFTEDESCDKELILTFKLLAPMVFISYQVLPIE